MITFLRSPVRVGTVGPRLATRLARHARCLSYTIGAAPGYFVYSASCGLAAAGCAAISPLAVRVLLDGLATRSAGESVSAALLLVILASAGWGLTSVAANAGVGLSERVSLYVSERFASALNQPVGTENFLDAEVNDQIETLRQSRRALTAYPRHILALVQLAVRVVVSVLLLAIVSPILLPAVLIAVVPAVLEKRAAAMDRAYEQSVRVPQAFADRMFTLGTDPAAAAELRVFGLGSEIIGRHQSAWRVLWRNQARFLLKAAAIRLAGWLAFVVVTGVAVLALARGDLGPSSPGLLLMTVLVLRRLQSEAGLISQTAGELGRAGAAARALDFLQERMFSHAADTRKAPAPSELRQGIALDNVCFSFPNGAMALRDISLELPAGSVVALVGENGAGKSTLMKVLCGLLAPTQGSISLDSTKIELLDARAFRDGITTVMQDFLRYELTAAENIAIGDISHVDDEEAIELAVRRAGAQPLLDRIGGPAAELGTSYSKGITLSGGEWQRLALARGSMRRQPLVLLLDEPAASLDPQAEYDMVARYSQVARSLGQQVGAITIITSHRFTTMRDVDCIVVLEGGTVAEHGSHTELLSKNGKYAELYSLQAASYSDQS